MSTLYYSYTPNLLRANGTFATTSEAQATASKTLIPTGFYLITQTNYLYQFGTNIYNLESNDLLMNDNGGALRRITTPTLTLTNQGIISKIMSANSDMTVTSYGTHTGTQASSGSITFSSTNGFCLTTDYGLVTFQSATTLCNLAMTIPSTGNITITFGAAAGTYILNYLTFNEGG